MPLSVFEFSDYRSFLRAHAEDRKRSLRNWSYGSWARRLQLAGTASITMVIHGQRLPGPKMTDTLVRYFDFSSAEAHYFRALIQLEKTKGQPHLQHIIKRELQRLSPRSHFQVLDDRTFTAISNWYFYAIRQLARFKVFECNAEWIQKRLRIKVSRIKIEKALEILKELRLIEQTSEGKWQATDQQLDTSNDVACEPIRRFHRESLELAKDSLDEVAIEERDIRGLTLSISREHMEEAKAVLRDFVERFSQDFGGTEGNEVYQLNIQFFPLTKTQRRVK